MEFVADGRKECIFAWGARSGDLHGPADGFSEPRSS